jgi:hypothetical protein
MMIKSLAVAAATAAAVASLTAVGAGANAEAGPRTMNLTSVEQHCGGADNGRRGDSLGDLDACRGRLRDSATNAAAGRAHWTCVYLGSEKAGADCTAVVRLRGGTLQAAGVLSHTSPRSVWAVTGGTGSYAGARGTVQLRQLSAKRTAATITLLP